MSGKGGGGGGGGTGATGGATGTVAGGGTVSDAGGEKVVARAIAVEETSCARQIQIIITDERIIGNGRFEVHGRLAMTLLRVRGGRGRGGRRRRRRRRRR